MSAPCSANVVVSTWKQSQRLQAGLRLRDRKCDNYVKAEVLFMILIISTGMNRSKGADRWARDLLSNQNIDVYFLSFSPTL